MKKMIGLGLAALLIVTLIGCSAKKDAIWLANKLDEKIKEGEFTADYLELKSSQAYYQSYVDYYAEQAPDGIEATAAENGWSQEQTDTETAFNKIVVFLAENLPIAEDKAAEAEGANSAYLGEENADGNVVGIYIYQTAEALEISVDELDDANKGLDLWSDGADFFQEYYYVKDDFIVAIPYDWVQEQELSMEEIVSWLTEILG